MELEFALEGAKSEAVYPWRMVECGVRNETADAPAKSTIRPPPSALVIDWTPLVRAILADVKRGVPVREISAGFHNALAEAIVAVARRVGKARRALWRWLLSEPLPDRARGHALARGRISTLLASARAAERRRDCAGADRGGEACREGGRGRAPKPLAPWTPEPNENLERPTSKLQRRSERRLALWFEVRGSRFEVRGSRFPGYPENR